MGSGRWDCFVPVHAQQDTIGIDVHFGYPGPLHAEDLLGVGNRFGMEFYSFNLIGFLLVGESGQFEHLLGIIAV